MHFLYGLMTSNVREKGRFLPQNISAMYMYICCTCIMYDSFINQREDLTWHCISTQHQHGGIVDSTLAAWVLPKQGGIFITPNWRQSVDICKHIAHIGDQELECTVYMVYELPKYRIFIET